MMKTPYSDNPYYMLSILRDDDYRPRQLWLAGRYADHGCAMNAAKRIADEFGERILVELLLADGSIPQECVYVVSPC